MRMTKDEFENLLKRIEIVEEWERYDTLIRWQIEEKKHKHLAIDREYVKMSCPKCGRDICKNASKDEVLEQIKKLGLKENACYYKYCSYCGNENVVYFNDLKRW